MGIHAEMAFSHVNEAGEAHMVNVAAKPMERRCATASGEILLKPETLRLIRENGLKKGDVLGVARIAGIQAAKQTSHLIPLCHGLSLDGIEVCFEVGTDRVTVTTQAECMGRTGVEMEAITAASIALVTIYDMCKAVDKEMVISGIRLVKKTKGGTVTVGASSPSVVALGDLRVRIITLSDRASSGVYEDKSGPAIQEILEQHELARRSNLTIERVLIPDDKGRFLMELQAACNAGCDVIISTGGTGIGMRDIAPDVVEGYVEKQLPGVMEAVRVKYGEDKPMARLSRSVAGVRGRCQIYTLPGSVKAVREYMAEILKTLDHVAQLLRGGDPHV